MEMTVPCAPSSLVLEGAAAEAQAKLPPLAAGLPTFMLIPKTPQGESMIKDNAELFDHMVRYSATPGGRRQRPYLFGLAATSTLT